MLTSSFMISLLFWSTGFFLMWKIPSWVKNSKPSVKSDIKGFPRVSIIIPARNEERRILPLLTSLRKQTIPPHEIIVVDDHSSDDTRDVAQSMGAKVISSESLPQGWNSKPWACWQGALHCTGELLLFLDPDTWLESDGFEKIVKTYLGKEGLFTVQPFHVTYKPHEQFSAFFNILLMAGTNAFTPLGNLLKPSAAFGPCMICNRKDYFTTRGHQSVRGKVLMDVWMARLFLEKNLPVACYGGRGAVYFRMYPCGMRELVQGWSKNIGTVAFSIRVTFLLMSMAWICGCFRSVFHSTSSLLAPLLHITWPQILIYFLYGLQIKWMLKRIGRFKLWTSFLFPLPLFFFAFIMLRSLILTRILDKVTWKGRTISTVRYKDE